MDDVGVQLVGSEFGDDGLVEPVGGESDQFYVETGVGFEVVEQRGLAVGGLFL